MEKKHQGLTSGHLTMMALGTVIGGSFFLGTSVAINAAGPSIIISYILGGILVYFTLAALSEMTVANPHSGSFLTFATRTFGAGTGFVVGWVYWTGMVLSMSSEAAAVSILIRNWFPSVPISLLGSLIIIGVTLLNLLGTDKLSKLESSLASVKVLAIVFFIILSVLLVFGITPNTSFIGFGVLANEPFAPAGIKGIAGSMLIVMFAYAGFEIIGLAASETANPKETVPKAIRNTVIGLVGFYILSVIVILPVVPTAELSENISPIVAALNKWGMGWASTVMNLVLITAILSASLAAMFGIGRMMRSLADKGQAPKWIKDKSDIPYRGILFSGLAMLVTLWFGLLFPRVYLFLISSGGFALLLTYVVILAAHIRFRKEMESSKGEKSQIFGVGYPYGSLIALIGMVVVIISMPFISGQGLGLFVGVVMTIIYSFIYIGIKVFSSSSTKNDTSKVIDIKRYRGRLAAEVSNELTESSSDKDRNKNK